jgi:hypothetical protein
MSPGFLQVKDNLAGNTGTTHAQQLDRPDTKEHHVRDRDQKFE